MSLLEDDASLSYRSKHLNHSLHLIPFVVELQFVGLDSALTAEVAAQLAGELKPHKERSVSARIICSACIICMYVCINVCRT